MPCGCDVAYSAGAENLETINGLLAEMQQNGCELSVGDPSFPVVTGACAALEGTTRFVCQ